MGMVVCSVCGACRLGLWMVGGVERLSLMLRTWLGRDRMGGGGIARVRLGGCWSGWLLCRSS